MSIRIVLADDHAVVCYGLAQALQQEEGIEIIGQTSDGRSTVAMARELLPDIVVMDITMPELNGIEATREIRRETPEVRVMALSMHAARTCIMEMFRAGASGYLLKGCDFAELVQALRIVADGKKYISPSISTTFMANSPYADENAGPIALASLTQREREVLQLLSEGTTTKRIALQLRISPKTVEAHRLRLMGKLGIDNIAQLTRYAIREGLTSQDL